MIRNASTKKHSTNAYVLFRQELQTKLQSEGKRLTCDELKLQCDDLWKHLDEIEKEKWKKKAKEDRMKLRNDKASRIVAAASSPFPIASTHLFGQKSKTPRIQKGSVLQAREDEILATDVEKRRLKDRKSFENAFTWKYETDKSALKQQKFYLVSSNILHNCPNNECTPAEIACVEFTLESGVTRYVCVPIKSSHLCIGFNVQEEMRELSRKTHQLTSDDLQVIGKSCKEVAELLIEMSHDREHSCRNIRFFVLSWEHEQTVGALRYLLKNTSLPEKYKNFTIQDAALIDDLAYAMFKFYDVDYPKPAPGLDTVDMSYLCDLIDVSTFQRVVCDVHDAYGDSAVCCLSQLYLHVEIIRTCVEMKKFNEQSLAELNALGVDALKLRYYEKPSSLRLRQIGGEGKAGGKNDDEIVDLHEAIDEADEQVGGIFESVEKPNELESFTDTLTMPFVSWNTATHQYLVKERIYSDVKNLPYSFRFPYGNVFLRAPNTYSVQNNLPSGRRGFGRGIGLTPEGQLYERSTGMKNLLKLNTKMFC